jgi:regulator of sigma E protease
MSVVGNPGLLMVFGNLNLEEAWPRLAGILGILVIFGLIIAFHEFGHFIAAKLNKMGVHEFSIGFGPPLIRWTRGETTYSIRAIPLGGFVRIAGMELEDSEEERKAPNSFYNKPYYAKFITIMAGALMNFVLALIVFIIIGAAVGYPLPGKNVTIVGVSPMSPAAKVGLQPGDRIVEVNGQADPTSEQTSRLIKTSTPPVRLVVERNGKRIPYEIEPTMNPSAERHGLIYRMTEYYGIGVSMQATSGGWERVGIGESIVTGARMVGDRLVDALAQFVSLVTRNIPAKHLSGPVGIMSISYSASQGAVVSREGLANFLGMIGLLSIFIGFFNLLPIPALDGGHLLFLTIEAIRGKPFDKKKLAVVHFVGLLLLLALVLAVSVKDVFQIFGKN